MASDKVALLTIHGMGETREDYAQSLLAALKNLLKSSDFERVKPYVVYYQDLMQPNQRAVWNVSKDLVHYDDLRKFVLFGFADAAGLYNGKDLAGSVYQLAQDRIAETLLTARADHGPDVKIVAIAQSLGCQVLSTYIWDAQQAVRAMEHNDPTLHRFPSAGIFQQHFIAAKNWTLDDLRFLACSNLWTMHTTGCNIPVFVAAHQQMQIKPIDRPHDGFKWINHYDPDDVLGWPLEPLGSGYETLVQDRRVNSGQGAVNFILRSWNPASHTTYWTDDDVVVPLAKDLTVLTS